MKELELTKSDIEMVIQHEAEKHYKKVGTIKRKIDGGKIFAIDCKTLEISEAKVRQDKSFVVGTEHRVKNPLYEVYGVERSTEFTIPDVIDTIPGKIYVEAINRDNAIKRLKKSKILFRT